MVNMEKLRMMMQERGIDLMIVSSGENIFSRASFIQASGTSAAASAKNFSAPLK